MLIDILIGFVICTAYYKYVKEYLFKFSYPLAKIFRLTRYYPLAQATGVIELCLAASSHLLFCLALTYFYDLYGSFKISFIHLNNTNLLFYGILAGIGEMSLSSLLCRTVMEITSLFTTRFVPKNIKEWLTISRGGWMRHYFNTLKTLPLPLALVIIICQIGAEEYVFRGIFLTFYLKYGATTAVLISTLLFMYIQIFQMPSFLNAMFPIIGALILGIVNSLLFLLVPDLLPLIVAHITFFLIAVL